MVNNIQEKKLLKRKEKALSTGNQNTLASTSIDLGEIYIVMEKYEDAIQEFILVSDVYKNMGKLLDYGRVCRRIGEAYINLQKYEKALEYQQMYLDIAKQQHSKLEEQRAFATIGHVYLTQYLNEISTPNKNSLNFALKAFNKSLAICESLTDIKKHEHKDMTARLLANLGVVHDCKGEYSKGIDLLEKSIAICKVHDLYEQLERGYTCLGALYTHKEEHNEAIQQYNLAVEVAERLQAKVPLMCASLQAKADILVKLADFHSARTELIKAYKLKHPDKNDREIIEYNLKTVAIMCRTEETLLTTGNSNYLKKKQLYEKLGDGACCLKNFSCAIEYYQKMLEAAKDNNETGLQLSPCYISLAATYRDNKQYHEAIQYFRKDFHCGKPKDQITTLLSIAECMEIGSYDLNEIVNVYEQALTSSEIINNVQLKFNVLTCYIAFLNKHGNFQGVNQLQCQLDEIDKDTIDTDCEVMCEQITPNVADDISINDITDISDDETENVAVRKRTKAFVVKRNAKGETQLHTASINGNLELVKRLLDQGHLVNIRDNCGWLPIHEACICGHLEVVRLLIENGAAFNDRGGPHCRGITPLHDAALNGHLKIVELLLDSGASSITKNDNGEIPLQILKSWRAENTLDDNIQELYNKLVKRLTQDAEKLGISTKFESSAIVTDAIVISPIKKERTKENLSQIGNLRRNLNYDEDLDTPRKRKSSKCFKSAKDEYKQVMEHMKRPLWEESPSNKRKSNDTIKKSAYVENEDNWLENDIPTTSKKRKTRSAEGFVNTTYQRSYDSFHRNNSTSNFKNKDDNEMLNNFFDSVYNVDDSTNLSPEINLPSTSTSNFKKSKKRQTSLLDSGFSRHPSFEANNSNSSNSSFSPNKLNSGSAIRDYDSTSSVDLNNIFNTEPTLSVDVRIDGKLYKVPVPASEIHTRTVRWLADEAALRYSRKECMKPDLELETKNGAVLADDDFISVLFSAGLTYAEEVEARIKKWNLLPLTERYTEACMADSINPAEKLVKILEEASVSLNLANLHLGDKSLSPLCRVISRQLNLHSVNLSGNFIHNNCFQLLCASLPTLDNLSDLNLSMNQLTFISLQYFTESFTQTTKPILTNLVRLDLSHNPLGNESFKFLCIITRYLRLKTLNLVAVGFTKKLFLNDTNLNMDLNLEHILNFDISYNELSNDEITTFLSRLKPHRIDTLNISNNTEVTQGLIKELLNWIESSGDEKLHLKTINLSGSCASDLEVSELLSHLTLLHSFDLSYNRYLTSLSLRRLLQSPVIYLNLTGCDEIFKYFEGCNITWNDMHIRELKISYDKTKYPCEVDNIINMWKNVYKDCAQIYDFDRFLHFSVAK